MLDSVILGDNQFFGINHRSPDAARQQEERFRSVGAIGGVLSDAYECGVRGFMLNTNSRAGEVCDWIRDNWGTRDPLGIYASLPYAHKYASMMNEMGAVGTFRELAKRMGGGKGLATAIGRGGRFLVAKDAVPLMRSLVDAEMSVFRGLPVRVIFLQNIVTDLLAGLGLWDMLCEYGRYVSDSLGCVPGFVTMNYPMVSQGLTQAGLDRGVICTNLNPVGFNMFPSQEAYEETLNSSRFDVMAMSIMASGAVSPTDAAKYLRQFPRVKSVVFGASKRAHIAETVECLRGIGQV